MNRIRVCALLCCAVLCCAVLCCAVLCGCVGAQLCEQWNLNAFHEPVLSTPDRYLSNRGRNNCIAGTNANGEHWQYVSDACWDHPTNSGRVAGMAETVHADAYNMG